MSNPVSCARCRIDRAPAARAFRPDAPSLAEPNTLNEDAPPPRPFDEHDTYKEDGDYADDDASVSISTDRFGRGYFAG
jgi:hypothetical protein